MEYKIYVFTDKIIKHDLIYAFKDSEKTKESTIIIQAKSHCNDRC